MPAVVDASADVVVARLSAFVQSRLGSWWLAFVVHAHQYGELSAEGDVLLYAPTQTGPNINGLLLTWYNNNWGTVCDDVTEFRVQSLFEPTNGKPTKLAL